MARSYQAKAQSSLEYLLVVALTFVVIVPAIFIFFVYSKETGSEIADSQIIKLGRTIIEYTEIIYYNGQGSKTILDLNAPEDIKDVFIIDGRELVFNVSTSFGHSEIVFLSPINITSKPENCQKNICRLDALANEGSKKVRIEAITSNSVEISVI